MPPYADHNNHDLSLVDVSLESGQETKSVKFHDINLVSDESSVGEDSTASTEQASKSFFKMPNPSSALFKVRTCCECGQRLHKFRNGGYVKDGEDYFHKDCLQVRNFRDDHRTVGGFGLVLVDLLDFFEARARKQREEQERLERMAREKEEEEKEAARIAAAAKNTKLPFAKRAKHALKSLTSKSKKSKSDTEEKPAYEVREQHIVVLSFGTTREETVGDHDFDQTLSKQGKQGFTKRFKKALAGSS